MEPRASIILGQWNTKSYLWLLYKRTNYENPNFRLQEPGAPDKPLNHVESQLVLFAQNKELAQELDTSFSIQQTLRHTHRPLWTEQDLGAREIKTSLY